VLESSCSGYGLVTDVHGDINKILRRLDRGASGTKMPQGVIV